MYSKLSSRKLWIGVALILLGTVLLFLGDREAGLILISVGGGGYLGMEGLADMISRYVSPSDTEEESSDEE